MVGDQILMVDSRPNAQFSVELFLQAALLEYLESLKLLRLFVSHRLDLTEPTTKIIEYKRKIHVLIIIFCRHVVASNDCISIAWKLDRGKF